MNHHEHDATTEEYQVRKRSWYPSLVVPAMWDCRSHWSSVTSDTLLDQKVAQLETIRSGTMPFQNDRAGNLLTD